MKQCRILVFALLWLAHLPAFALIGTVDALEGDVRISSVSGGRWGSAGAEINEGDTVKTGDDAWALLTMSDGASLTLRPNSQLRFDVYRYSPDGNASDNVGVLGLLRGALRSVTGYIGRSNRSGYKIVTPTAAIGIRGTDHEPSYYPPGEHADRDPGTYDKVNDGESFIRNAKGEVSVKPGQYAFVHHDARSAPRILQRPPAFYQRHAEFDKKAAARRQEFHRRFEEQQLRRAQDHPKPRGNQPLRAGASSEPAQQREILEKQKRERLERQQQQRELTEKRQQERQVLQQQRRQQLEQEMLKRQEDRAKKQKEKEERDKQSHKRHE